MTTTSPRFDEQRADGYRYVGRGGRGGHEIWLSPKTWHRNRISTVRCHAKKRAAAKGVPFAISVDDLVQIFPADGRCPVTGDIMEWGGGLEKRGSSPSLDRIVPSQGYVLGNLCWISNRANILKRDADLHELEALVAYMKNPPIQ